MNVQFFSPGKACSSLIKQYQYIQYDHSKGKIKDIFVPRYDISLVFNFGGTAKLHDGNKVYNLPTCFIAPVLFRPVKIELDCNIDSFIVTCNASRLSRLTGIIPGSCQKPFMEIYDKGLQNLRKEMENFKTIGELIDKTENFILSAYAPDKYIPDEIDIIYEALAENPFIKLSSLSITINERTLRRKFKSRIGVNAKFLSRLVRLNIFWQKLTGSDTKKIDDLIKECGYSDQSHFINDFKAVAGETPKNFFSRNHTYARIFAGRNF